MFTTEASRRSQAAASARIRATHAEREEVVQRLQQAFTDGRLDSSEFDERIDSALTARTREDLRPLVADVTEVPVRTDEPVGSGAERVWASLSHLLVLCSGFVGPLLVLLAKGRDSSFVRRQAAESLNFQITFLLTGIGLSFATVMTFGLAALLYIPLGIAWFVLPLVGGCASAGGTTYRYPVNLRLVR